MVRRSLIARKFLVGVAIWMIALGSAQGQAKEKEFESPLGNFSVPVPQGIGARIQHQGDAEGGIVAFHDDFGSYRSIFYLRIPTGSGEQGMDSDTHRQKLEAFFNEVAMKQLFKPVSSSASVLHAEQLRIDKGSAYFAIVDLPEGSTMFDAKTKKRFNTRRGMLVFTVSDFVYIVGSGENPSVLELGRPEKPLDKLIESERARVLQFTSSIGFR